MRPIDADLAVRIIHTATAKELYTGELTGRLGNGYNYHAIAVGYNAAIDAATEAIKAAPTIDSVPVVRCKDCKNYNQNPYSEQDEKLCMCWSDWIPTEPDDFCSYGERKDDDTIDCETDG